MATDRVRAERELMRGAAPLAVMHLLAEREAYGYELVEALADRSGGVLALGQSTLYPLLYNLEAKGLVRARYVQAESGRTRRYYSLTAAGRRSLTRRRTEWNALARAMRALGVADTLPEAP